MKIKLFIVALLCVTITNAQKTKVASIKWGPELEGSRRGSVSDFLGFDDNGYYVSAYGKDFLVEKLDKNLGEPKIYTYEEKDPETKEKYELYSRQYFADHLYVFKKIRDRKTKINTLYVEEINKNTMEGMGKMKKISEIAYESRRDQGGFSLIASPGDKYMMIVESIPTEKEENERFNVIMLDDKLEPAWKKELTLPYVNSLFARSTMIVDDEGNFYVLGCLYRDKESRVKGEVNYTYHLIAFNDHGDSKIDYEIKLSDKFISAITFNKNKNGDLTCAGFYSNKGGGFDGSFFLTLDPTTKQIKASNYKEFSIEFMTEYLSEKDEKKLKKKEEKGKDVGFGSYSFRDMIRRSDGGAILIAENYYSYTVTSRVGNSTYTTTYYNYNDIIIVNIDSQGKIQWTKKIPKRQTSANDGGFYSSYALAVTDEYLSFIYNDHIDNMDMENTRQLKNFNVGDRKGCVVIATVDNNGKLKKDILMDNKEVEVIICPKVCEQIDDSRLLIFGKRKKVEQFGMVTFQ